MPNNVGGSATFATRVIDITTANNAIPAGIEVEFTVANVEKSPGVIAANNVQADARGRHAGRPNFTKKCQRGTSILRSCIAQAQ